jgi:uncharacterized repeat protein (TIGR01451 family)
MSGKRLHTSVRPKRPSLKIFAALAVTGVVAAMTAPLLSAPAAADPVPLTVSMSSSTSQVASGTQLTYTIDVNNGGGAQVDEVVMTDQLNGLTGLILTSTVGACSQTFDLVTCDAGSLEGFQSWQVTIRGVVTASNGTTLHNTATVSGTKSSNSFTTSATASVLVSNSVTGPLPDLSISTQAPTSVGDNQDVTFNLTVNNTGTAKASEIRVVDTLPIGFSFESVTSTSLFACSGLGITVTCAGGAVNFGATATISIMAKSGFSDPPPFKNTAVVDPYNEIDELNELNNTSNWLIGDVPPPPQTGLTITKEDLVDPIRPAQVETYKIHVTNTAATRADSISVVDGTQGLDAASIQATTTKGVCTVAAPKVTCTQKSPTLRLEPGESLDITIKGTVLGTAGTLITNTATVSGNIKNKGNSNTAVTTTTVRPGVDLSVVQHSVTNHDEAPPPVAKVFRAWDDYNYEISIGNSGLDDANNVVVREPLPTGVDLKSFLAPLGVSCAEVDNVVTCTGLKVQGVESSGLSGGTVEMIVLTVIAPPQTGTISATVTVDPANAILESDEANNSTSTTTNVQTGIDLTISKDSEPVVAPSGTLIYTIKVQNIGTQDASGVVVRDPLPSGTRFREISGTTDHNFTCSYNGPASGSGVVECVGGILRGTHDHTLAPDEATIKVVLFAPRAPGFIKNQVRVDPDNTIPEIVESNNINTKLTDIEIGGCCVYNDFTIDKTQTQPAGNVAPSGVLEYDITVSNTGSDVAFGVAVRDFIPDGAIFRYAEDTLPGSGAFSCTAGNGVIDCVGGTLDGSTGQTPAAGDTTRTIHVGLFAPAQPGTYTNQAVVDPDDTIPEGNETNNSDTVTTTVALGGGGSYIDLKVDSSQTSPVDGSGNPQDVVPHGVLQYSLKVENVGTAVAFDVTVNDKLPVGSVFRSAQDTNAAAGAFTCSESGGTVTCTGGTLDGSNNDTPAAGDNVRTIVVNVFAPTQPGSYTNQAEIDPNHQIAENDETNNSDSTTTKVALTGDGNYVDLRIKSYDFKDANGPTDTSDPSKYLQPDAPFDYQVVVENTGTDAAFNVDLANNIPDGFTIVSMTGDNDFVCDKVTGRCTGGAIDGSLDQLPDHDSEATFTVRLMTSHQEQSESVFSVRVDPSNTIAESNETNNSKTSSQIVQSRVNLTSTAPSGFPGQGSSGTVDFSIASAEVQSGAFAFGPTSVVANLPVGTIVLNIDNQNNGWSCTTHENPVNQIVCTGTMGVTETKSFTANVYTTAEGTVNASSYADPDNTVVERNEQDNGAP